MWKLLSMPFRLGQVACELGAFLFMIVADWMERSNET